MIIAYLTSEAKIIVCFQCMELVNHFFVLWSVYSSGSMCLKYGYSCDYACTVERKWKDLDGERNQLLFCTCVHHVMVLSLTNVCAGEYIKITYFWERLGLSALQ